MFLHFIGSKFRHLHPGNESNVVYYKRAFCACDSCLNFKKRKQKIRKGPLQGHSPKEFKPRWGSLYEDDADDEDEPEQDDDLQGAQDGDAEDSKRGKTDRKPGKGRKSGRKGGAWGAW